MFYFIISLLITVSFLEISSLSPSSLLTKKNKTLNLPEQETSLQAIEKEFLDSSQEQEEVFTDNFAIEKMKLELNCILCNLRRDQLDRYVHLSAYLIDSKNQRCDSILPMHHSLYVYLRDAEFSKRSEMRLKRDFALLYSIVNQALVRTVLESEGEVKLKVSRYFSQQLSLESLFLSASILTYYSYQKPYSYLKRADFHRVLEEVVRPILNNNSLFRKQITAPLSDPYQTNDTISVNDIIYLLKNKYQQTPFQEILPLSDLLYQTASRFKINKKNIKRKSPKKSFIFHSDTCYIKIPCVMLFLLTLIVPFLLSPSLKVYVSIIVTHSILLIILSALLLINTEFTFKRIKTLFFWNKKKSSQSVLVLILIYLISCILSFNYLKQINSFIWKLMISLLFAFGLIIFVNVSIGEIKILCKEAQVHYQIETIEGLSRYSVSFKKLINYRLLKEWKNIKFLLVSIFLSLLIIITLLFMRGMLWWNSNYSIEFVNKFFQITSVSILSICFIVVFIFIVYLFIKKRPCFQYECLKKNIEVGPFEEAYQKRDSIYETINSIRKNRKFVNKIIFLNLFIDILVLSVSSIMVLFYNYAMFESLLIFCIVSIIWLVRWFLLILLCVKRNLSYFLKKKRFNILGMIILGCMILLSVLISLIGGYVGILAYQMSQCFELYWPIIMVSMGLIACYCLGIFLFNKTWWFIKTERLNDLQSNKLRVFQRYSIRGVQYSIFIDRYC